MKRFARAAVILAALAAAGGSARADNGAALGTWMMSNGKVTINVAPCNGNGLCGTLAALKEPLDKHGRPKRDVKNPNPALRDRPVIGITLFTVAPAGNNSWKGSIYNADDGHTYSSSMSLDGKTMNVKGCFLIICKKLVFNKIK